ncbi:patatin-like phospholipase domain-containing protein 4 isoform X1 [Ahaetulla prasina]|uniref:patatin-like phospholipase domain-containing protein 4 isoform X1 n=1 Tax=Ahaetulla prasina TaxID=499056 RepID=UPI0026498B2F|nr:patatin-like phospholipase domain-containing protein 4 isoform X1 [Ahaetulla prasina]XP_058042133.1 patatin-like phospholipase domain-containing protein 4 isoform X1 [Ahaetulla prasina]XP_058042134.1 patatin-like phospholipase domain-containing protein 4 isoform X1 [Ahaetulla prasina]
MWATKRIYRSLKQRLQLKQYGLHNSLCRAKSFEKSDQCYVLQAFHLLPTCSASSHNTWFMTDMKTNLNVTEGNKVNKTSSKSLDGGRHLEMEAKMKHLNLSFAASGFLGIYHLGAASALCRHGKKLLKVVKAFAGASSGALTATVLLTVPESIEKCTNITYQLAEDTRKLYFGALTPGYDLMTKLRSYIDSILPPNAHEIAENRLFISVTSTKNGKNYLLSHFASREDLVKALLASSFIPLYAGINAVDYKGQKWIDGGLTNGLPILPKGRTVTVSPFCGRLDICPENKGRVDIYAKVAKQDIMLSIGNFIRLHQALFPPSQEKMESLYQDGYDDAIQFLLKENWFE